MFIIERRTEKGKCIQIRKADDELLVLCLSLVIRFIISNVTKPANSGRIRQSVYEIHQSAKSILYLTTLFKMPEIMCELDFLFLIKSFASLVLHSVVLTVPLIYHYYICHKQTCIHTRKQQTHSSMLLLQYCWYVAVTDIHA
jgi:hypothetical protein